MQSASNFPAIARIKLFVPAVGVMMLAVLWTIVILDLDYKRQQTLYEAKKHLIEASEIVSRKLRSLSLLADVTLLDLSEHWEDSPERIQRRLKQRFETFGGASERAGISFYSVSANPSRQEFVRWPNAMNEPWFRLHADSLSSGVMISQPMRDELSKEVVVLFTRAVRNPQGRFLGVVVASVPIRRMVNLYPFLNLDNDGVFTVFRSDGLVLARATSADAAGQNTLDPGVAESSRKIFAQFERTIREQGNALIEIDTPLDKVKRLQYFAKVENYPFVVLLGQSMRDALMPYEEVRTLHLFGGAALSLSIFLGLFLFMIYQRDQLRAMSAQQEQMDLLQAAQDSLQRSRENLRTLAMRQQDTVEDERKRMAQEIHDELGQRLSLLRLELAMLASRADAAETSRELTRIKTQTDDLIEVVRDVANRLRPGTLEAGLQLALDALIQDFARTSGIKVSVTASLPSTVELSESVKIAAYRIAQEALTNIARHAQAKNVKVSLTAADGSLQLRIRDDGIGFDPDQRKSSSMGITGMSERALSVGGHISFSSTAKQGTELMVRIPLTHGIKR